MGELGEHSTRTLIEEARSVSCDPLLPLGSRRRTAIIALCDAVESLQEQLDTARHGRADSDRLADMFRAQLEAAEAENQRLRAAVDHFWKNGTQCPCGARPESPVEFPHVISCPVGAVLDSVAGGELK